MTWKAFIIIIISIIISIIIIYIIIFITIFIIIVIIHNTVIIIIIIISLIELSITESNSPLELQRSLHPAGSPGAAHCQPGQPDLSPPWQPPQLEWSSQTHPGPHCHSSSPVSHRVHHKH